MKDKPDGVEYAAGKALFVIPKKHPLDKPTDGAKERERAHAAGRPSKIAIHLKSCLSPAVNLLPTMEGSAYVLSLHLLPAYAQPQE